MPYLIDGFKLIKSSLVYYVPATWRFMQKGKRVSGRSLGPLSQIKQTNMDINSFGSYIYVTHIIITHGLYIFYTIFPIYIVEWLVLQTIYVLNEKILHLLVLMPYSCCHFYFNINSSNRLYLKEKRPGSPLFL